MGYETSQVTTNRRDEALIPNTQIESMFMRIAVDSQMIQYVKLVDEGHISLATAYASNLVYKLFYALIDVYEKSGGNVESLNKRKVKES